MKKLLPLLLILTGCIKSIPCNQKIFIPINFTLDNQESFSYVNVDIGNEYILNREIYWGDQSGFKIYSDSIDVTDMNIRGRVGRTFTFFSLDGSYKIFRDTVEVK